MAFQTPTDTPAPKSSTRRRSRLLHAALAAAAVGFLLFAAGAFTAEFKLFPYPQLFQDPFEYVRAVNEHKRETALARAKGATIPREGRLTVPPTAQSQPGYTFLTFDAARPSTARLLDHDGNLLHEWHRDFREIWPQYPNKKARPAPDDGFAWRYGHLFPNGDVLVTIKDFGDTPDGYGLAKLDKSSTVLWAIPEHFHHHFSIDPATGTIYTTTHQWRDTTKRPVPGLPHLPKLVLEDFVVTVSPDGQVLSRVSLLDAMAAPGTRALLSASIFNQYDPKDWDRLHTNDVEFITPEFAAQRPSFPAGSVLVSVRELNALALLDLTSKKILRVIRGPWVRQHDPDLLPNGNLLVFDNRGDDIAGANASRILEFDPDTGLVTWAYEGTPDNPFRSDVCGAQQRLPNGNTLIADYETGRLFETTPHGQTVWEYRDVRLHQATRIPPDYLQFTPTAPRPDATTTAAAAE